MMNKILTAFVLCFMFIGFNQIAAQPSIFIDPNFALVAEGDNVSVDITTNDFTAIQEFRFTMEYDEEVLQYNSATFNATLNASGGCTVTTNNATDPARLTVECILDADCNSAPATDVTLPDGELIVTLDFTAINGYTDLRVIDDINDPDDHYVQRICNDIGLIVDEPSTIAVDNLPVTINVPDVNANSGEQICLDFSLLDFEDIISMQYTIAWDPAVLEFVQVDGFNLPGISSDNFNLLPSQDALVFTWNDPFAQEGTTVADGTFYTQVCFNVVGDCNDVSTIQIQSIPTPVEITNADDPGQDIGFLNGQGTVTVNCNNPDGLGLNVDTPTACINPGESFTVCTEVSNFVDLEEFAFTLNWNPSVLQLDDVTFPSGLAAFGNGQIDNGLSGQGLLGVNWSDPSCNGVNLADGVDLICMDFTSVGSGGVNSSIYVTGDLEPINVTTQCGGSDNLGVNVSNGLVEICVPAGITISTGDYDVDPGDVICVPVEVQDFTDVESFSINVAWEQTILSYVNTDNPALGGISFDESLSGFGYLCAQWTGAAPETLNDGTAVFEICFEATGAPFTCSPISFPVSLPCEQSVVTSESGGFSVDINDQDGEVCMVNPSSLDIEISNANGSPGENVCVDFTVNNFVSLSDVSFTIEWDNTVLEYVELINPGTLPNFDSDSYSENNASIGVIGVEWESNSTFGNSMPNGGNIFSLCFNPIGGSGECADITITSTFVNIEVLSAFGGNSNLGLGFTEGEICIEEFVSITSDFITPASCENVDDGAIDITVDGGSNAYIFEWVNDQTNATFNTEDLTNVISGNYTLTITDQFNPNLTASFNYTIGLSSSAPVVDAGEDFSMPCDNIFGTMSGSATQNGNPVVGATILWTDLSGTNNVFPTNVLNPQVGGSGTFELAVTVGNCTVTDVVTVFPKVLPAAAVSFADQDTVLTCLVSAVNLTSETSSDFADPNIQYIWTASAGGVVPLGTENDQNISVAASGTYTLEVLNNQSDCSSFASIIVELDDVVPVVAAGDDVTLDCDNSTTILEGVVSDAGDNPTYEWTDQDGNPISSNLITAELSLGGTYTLTVTNEENGCVGTDELVIDSDLNLPVISINSILQIDCDNPTVTIDAVGSSDGPDYVYTWFMGNDELVGETGTTLDVSIADTYSLTILDTTNNCSQSATSIVSDSTALPTIPQLASGIISCDVMSTAITNDLADVAHYTFDWSGPAVDPGSENLPEPTVNLYGEYTVLVTNLNTGCFENEVINVGADTLVSSVSSLTVIDGNLNSELTCDDPLLTLELDLDDNGDFSIIWAGPGIDATNELQPVISAPGTVFAIFENNANGCIDTLSQTTTENTVDPLITGIDSDITEWGCDDTEATLTLATGISNPGDYIYDWVVFGCNGITLTNNDNSATVSGPCQFNVNIEDPTNGCVVSESITIEDIRSTPDINLASGSVNLNCLEPASAELTGESTVTGAIYEWTFEDGTPVGSTSTVTVFDIGEYTLTVTDPSNNCEADDSVPVNAAIYPAVTAGSNMELGCLDNEVVLAGSSLGDVTYSWDGPCIVAGDDTANVSVECPGIYYLEVEDNITGCSSIDSTEVILVYDIEFADASFTSDPCVTEEVQLDGNVPAAGVTGLWVVEPASVNIDNPSDQSIVIFDLDPGTYTATWTLSTDNCPEYSNSEVTFDVLSAPVANNDELVIDDNNPFGQIDLLANDDIFSGYNYVVTVNDSPGVGEFLVSNSEVEYTPSPLLFDGFFDLSYEVCVEGCENLCSEALLSILINRSVDADADFPNTITPNGDGVNDEFIFDLLTSSPGKYPDNNMIIFNRWGDIVFQAAPYTNNWSGQNDRGQDLPEGTYYYVLELDVANGIILNGSITILR